MCSSDLAAGAVTPLAGIVLGLLGGFVCYQACLLKSKFGYDDALDAFGVHGVGGTLGAVLTGVFATQLVVPGSSAAQGLLEGNAQQVVNQVVGVVASGLLGVIGTFIILKVVDALMGLRVTNEEEIEGLDINLHGETVH